MPEWMPERLLHVLSNTARIAAVVGYVEIGCEEGVGGIEDRTSLPCFKMYSARASSCLSLFVKGRGLLTRFLVLFSMGFILV